MNKLQPDPFLSKAKFWSSVSGILFLTAYWLVGFDGITFSDDVYYLLAGQKFWQGTMEVSEYHFSSRWGAYIPSGLIGYFLGFDPHRISLISLLSYLSTLLLLLKIIPKEVPAWVLILWFCTQIYFLHFLTKVYPDSLLVLWTCLVPVAASFRKTKPAAAGVLMVLALFIGFITKETIIFLAPFPLLLLYLDTKEKEQNYRFYYFALGTGILLGIAYLGYFWIVFGSPIYRITSINAGHYISEYTYADKGFWSILKRLTILPIQTFVQRAYWPWLVFALPGIVLGWKNRNPAIKTFAVALACLMTGFWFMSSTLEFYNPIYLNPRHLIILIPILTYLIAVGWKSWWTNVRWKNYLSLLLGSGVLVSLLMLDWKMAAFNSALLVPVFVKNHKISAILFGIILIFPAIYSIAFQKNLKQYNTLIETLRKETQTTDYKKTIYTHTFLDFSKKILIPDDSIAQKSIIPLNELPQDSTTQPKHFKVLIYDYYLHAYPQEQKDVDAISDWLSKHYQLVGTERSGNSTVSEYELK